VHEALAIVVPQTIETAGGRYFVVFVLDNHVDALGLIVAPVLEAPLGDIPVTPSDDTLRVVATGIHRRIVGAVLQRQLVDGGVVRRQIVGIVPRVVHHQGTAVPVLADDEVVRETEVLHEDRLDLLGPGAITANVAVGHREIPVDVDSVGVLPVTGRQTVRIVERDDVDVVIVHQVGDVLVTGDTVIVGQVIRQVQQQLEPDRFVAVHGAAEPDLGLGFLAGDIVGDPDHVQVTPLDRGADVAEVRDGRVIGFDLLENGTELGIGVVDPFFAEGQLVATLGGLLGPDPLHLLAHLSLQIGESLELVSGLDQGIGFGLSDSRLEEQAVLFGGVPLGSDLFPVERGDGHQLQQRVQLLRTPQFDADREIGELLLDPARQSVLVQRDIRSVRGQRRQADQIGESQNQRGPEPGVRPNT